MLVGFNPYMSSNKSNRQSPTFKSLQNGIIEAKEIAKSIHNAGACYHGITGGVYKPSPVNLKGLLDAVEIAKNDKIQGVEIVFELKDNIELLIETAKNQGVFSALNTLFPQVKNLGINL